MEQRTLRLGDMVDDYCPRERRITNHAIVALVGDEIRQTRCTTCDGEHVYKQGRAPSRLSRAKDGASDAAGGQLVPRAAAASADSTARDSQGKGDAAGGQTPADPQAPGSPAGPPGEAGDDQRAADGWLANRPLIRATLPRIEGVVPTPRPIPEFTMHQRSAYPARPFRHGQGRPGGSGQSPSGFGSGGFGSDRNGNHGNPGNGQGRPGPGAGRSRRRRGGRHKPPG